MKLSLSCIRDTLVTLEDWLILNNNLEFISLSLDEICKSSEMLKHSKSDIAYTLVILNEAGFIEAIIDYGDFNCICELEVIRLTYSGHQFIDAIRPQATWDKIYDIAEKTGLKSVAAIMKIADALLPETIKHALHP